MNILTSKTKLFITLFFVAFFHLSFAQEVVWLDENHNQTTESNGTYYRPITEKIRGGYFNVKDYYKNGGLYRTGKAEFMTVQKEIFKGFVTYFNEDESVLKEEKYKNGLLDGPYREYYPTGELKVDGVYDKGIKDRVWKIYYKTGKIKTKGKYRNGKKVGEWTTFYRDVYYPYDD